MRFSPDIQALIDNPRVLFFCSHSGGKDSQAMFILLKQHIPKERLISIHADLGVVEWEGVKDHVEKNVNVHELHIVKDSETFFEMVRKRGMWPSSMTRQCTSNQKERPIFKKILEIMAERGCDTAVNCMGLRAEESSARAKKSKFEINEKRSSTRKGRTIYNWLPIFDWSTREVFRYIMDNGEKPHHAYELGMSRLSCRFCILANRQDLKVSASHNPDLLEEYAALEREINHTIFMDNKKPIGIKEYINKPYVRTPKKLVRLADCY